MRTRLLAFPLALVFLAACDLPLGPAASTLLNPGCASPAPVLREPDPELANQWIVQYHDGTDAQATTARLAREHGFAPRFVYEHAIRGFSAELTPQALAGVRCASEVKYVEGNGMARGGI